MKTLTLLVLLVTSQFSHAASAIELDCVARSVYHEARSLPKQHWIKVANVIQNRSKHYKKYRFGSKSSHLCDIVKSNQFSSNRMLTTRIKEPEIYGEIRETLKRSNWKTTTNALYFETKKGQMIYNTTWRK
jgi:spore germination cell wall hydrolase CwlJ-like protein